MFQNRISGFAMGLGDQQDSPAGQPLPVQFPRVTMNVMQPMPMAVNIADIFQAAASRAVQDYELNRLFNPDHYDYQI